MSGRFPFFRKKNQNTDEAMVQLAYPAFSLALKATAEYANLLAAVGHEAAEESIKDMFWSTTKHQTPGFAVYECRERFWPNVFDIFRNKMVVQRQKALETKDHVKQLFHQAMTTKLGVDVRKPENIMPQTKYGATDKDIDAVKGAKWIKNASNSYNTPGDKGGVGMSVDDIANVIIDCNRFQMSVFDLSTLKYLHDRLVPKESIPERRALEETRPWPSYGVSKFLQKMVADMVYSINPNGTYGLKDVEWDSFACFFLGAYMRTHGFPDGNGRPNRALYVLSMIQGFRPFVAPNKNFTDSRLTGGGGLF